MRILYDGYWWVDGPFSNRQVMKSLLDSWLQAFPEDDIAVVVPRQHLDQARAERPDLTFAAAALRPHGISVMIEYGRLAKRWGADAVFTHNYTARHSRSFVFIQDLLFVDYPQWFTWLERVYFAPMRFAHRAKMVFASSAAEGDRIHRILGEKAQVVPIGLGLDMSLFETPGVAPRSDILPHRFALSVGRLNVRKNLAMVLRVASGSSEISGSCPLIVVGEVDGRVAQIPPEAQPAVRDGSIMLLGSVSVEELVWLYSNARLFVYLSLAEGFGLPPIEAASLGSAVLVSDIGVFRETLGSAATYVDATDDGKVKAAFDEMMRLEWAPGQRAGAVTSTREAHSWRLVTRRLHRAILEACE